MNNYSKVDCFSDIHIKMESIRQLSNFNFQWTKILSTEIGDYVLFLSVDNVKMVTPSHLKLTMFLPHF